MEDFAYLDAKLMRSSHGRKEPSFHPMQQNAYFSVTEPMGSSVTDMGSREQEIVP